MIFKASSKPYKFQTVNMKSIGSKRNTQHIYFIKTENALHFYVMCSVKMCTTAQATKTMCQISILRSSYVLQTVKMFCLGVRRNPEVLCQSQKYTLKPVCFPLLPFARKKSPAFPQLKNA